MNITSRQLKAFVLTARHQSFSRAAEQLFITQSGMSVLVRELETQLGVRLFERTTRKVALTAFGSQFLPIADRNLRELEAAAANLSRSAAAASDCLSVGAAPFPAAEIMPQAISAYMALRPRLHIQMIDAERTRLIDLVQSGKIDVAVLTGVREELPGMRQTSLARFALMLICPADDPRELPLELRWSDLTGLRLIGLPPEYPIQKLVDEQLIRAGRGTHGRHDLQLPRDADRDGRGGRGRGGDADFRGARVREAQGDDARDRRSGGVDRLLLDLEPLARAVALCRGLRRIPAGLSLAHRRSGPARRRGGLIRR